MLLLELSTTLMDFLKTAFHSIFRETARDKVSSYTCYILAKILFEVRFVILILALKLMYINHVS